MKAPRLFPLALLILAPAASADVITGRVVDSNGVGVAGVDLDFTRAGGGGGNAHEMNDGTDVNGFFTTTVDPDVWDVIFFPPTPPATTLLATVVPNVNANGPIDIGTVVLPPGVLVTGTVRGVANIPVAGVKVNVFDNGSGDQLPLKNNTTSAFGVFNLALPPNQALDFQYLTANVFGQTLAPQEILDTTFTGTTNLGDLVLLQGSHLSGTVRHTNATAVVGADIDVLDAATGDKYFTPGDNTTAAGTFNVVVPTGGTYDVMICHPPAENLVAVDVNNLVLGADTNLGVLTMQPGVVMSGTIRNRNGSPHPGADINVYQPGTTIQVPLCQDNANGTGAYAVIVPIGTFDVVFSPTGPHPASHKDRHNGVVIGGPIVLNGQVGGRNIVHTPGPTKSGTYLLPFTGSTGGHPVAPALTWSSPSTTSGSILTVANGTPGTVAVALVGFEHRTLRGLEVVRPALRTPLTLDAAGTGWIELPPLDPNLTGVTVFAQLVQPGKGPTNGIASSPILGIELR
jgi:hypothetical protein